MQWSQKANGSYKFELGRLNMKNVIDQISLEMGLNEKKLPDKKDVITDDAIIAQIQQIEDLEQRERDGRTLLINAAFYCRSRIVEYLINKNVDINAKDKIGYTPLHAAVQENDIEIVKLLLGNGADVNAKDNYGNSPLAKTMLNTPIEIFQILLNYGANPNEKNNFGYSVIDTFQAYPKILNILQAQ